ncbi:MAG: hypothetical protein HZA20_04685 [Nitrospirae bacterium]|nr:hypothetical protein [Nitrospirota bacterium]
MTSAHKGKPFLTIVKDNYGTQLSRTDLQWEYVTLGSPYPVFSRIKSKNTTTTMGGVSVWSGEAYAYDNASGMVKSVSVSGSDAESVTTANEYQNYGESAVYRGVWRLKKTTVTGSVSGKVRESTSDYFSTTGNLRSQSAWFAGGSVNPTVYYTYYTEGNLYTQTDAMQRMTYYYYDATSTFPVTVDAPSTPTGFAPKSTLVSARRVTHGMKMATKPKTSSMHSGA